MLDLQTQTILIAGLQERGASVEAVSFAVSLLAGDRTLITRSRSKHAEAQAKYWKKQKKLKEEAASKEDHTLISADHNDQDRCIISYLPTYVKTIDVEVKELPVKQVMLNQVPVSQARARKKSITQEVLFDDWPADYGEQFWNAYPKKNQKTKTIQLLTKIMVAGVVSWQDLMFGLSRYSDNLPAWQSWCWPIKWLTEERWNSNPAEEDQYGKRRSRSELIQTAERLADPFGSFDRGIGSQTEVRLPASAHDARLLSNGRGQ